MHHVSCAHHILTESFLKTKHIFPRQSLAQAPAELHREAPEVPAAVPAAVPAVLERSPGAKEAKRFGNRWVPFGDHIGNSMEFLGTFLWCRLIGFVYRGLILKEDENEGR